MYGFNVRVKWQMYDSNKEIFTRGGMFFSENNVEGLGVRTRGYDYSFE